MTLKLPTQCKTIDRSLSKGPKGVYKNFRGIKINDERLPSKDEVESFWRSIWHKNVTFNKDAPWKNDLVLNYGKDATQNVYSIDLKTLSSIKILLSIIWTQIKLQIEILSSHFGTKILFTKEKLFLLSYKTIGKLIIQIGCH